MTDESADRYDTQVEVLFKGTANAMRRQALPAAARGLRRTRSAHGLRLHRCRLRHRPLPRFRQAGLAAASRRSASICPRPMSGTRAVICGAGGGSTSWSPMRRRFRRRTSSIDAVTSIFMMHELPPPVRRVVVGECARVLKPGGRLILLDSLQRGDAPAL